MDRPIYLDYNATTPLAPEVLAEMLPWMTEQFWNAASSHHGGRSAAAAVERARRQLADLVHCSPRDLVWTSGSTEANNLALIGSTENAKPGSRVLVAATEHKAVLDTAHSLERRGFQVGEIPVDGDGLVHVGELKRLLDDSVVLVSVMLANNETGVIQPLRELAVVAHEVGAVVHTDATQAVGKLQVDLELLGVDLASMSAHKFYGPKGVGALYIRRGVQVAPQMHGGGHEQGHRSGTLNVPAIVGMGAAAALAAASLTDGEAARLAELVDYLVARLSAILPDIRVVASDSPRLPNTVNVRFIGADAEAIMANAPVVMVSSGSACTSNVPEPSHVLQAMGLPQADAYECLRFSVGRGTTKPLIDEAVEELARAVGRVRHLMQQTDSVSTFKERS